MFLIKRAGQKFTDRGDPDDFDYAIGDFTRDGAFHDLDLSAIVGVGIRLVLLDVSIYCTVAANSLRFRCRGLTNELNKTILMSQVASVRIAGCMWILTDASGVIEYKCTAGNWTEIGVTVRGWLA